MENNELQTEVVSQIPTVSQLMIQQMQSLANAKPAELQSAIQRSTAMAKAGAVIISAEKQMQDNLRAQKGKQGFNAKQLGNG